MTKLSTILVCSYVAACSGAQPGSPASRPPPTGAQGPAPNAAPVASALPAASSGNTAPDAPSPFKVVGELSYDVKLFPAGERGFIASQEGIVFALDGDQVIHDLALSKGLPPATEMFSLESIAGRWPDAAWLSTTHPAGRSGFSSLWSWDGKRWTKKQSTTENRFIFGIRPWTGGRMLAIEQSGMMFDASFKIVSGDKQVVLPEFAKHGQQYSFCYTEMLVQAFVALPSGEVFAAGQHCTPTDETIGPAVERWAPGAKRGTLEALPGSRLPSDPPQIDWSVTGLVALSPSNVVLAAHKDTWDDKNKKHLTSEYFAHFDGTSWQALPPPVPDGIATLSAASDGTLFATSMHGQLWTRATSGAWSRVPLPKDILRPDATAEVTSFWSHAPGDDWAIVVVTIPEKERRQYLLHTHPGVSKLPTFEELDHEARELRLPGPPVDWCSTPFVLLYTLGKKAPPDYDYPATRAALKGHRELQKDAEFIEFTRQGRRYFGARVTDFKVGKKLAVLVKDKVPGSTPELVCHDPLEARKLDLDLTTGEIRK